MGGGAVGHCVSIVLPIVFSKFFLGGGSFKGEQKSCRDNEAFAWNMLGKSLRVFYNQGHALSQII